MVKRYSDIVSRLYSVVLAKLIVQNIKIHINPTGRLVCGGSLGDTGLTGCTIIVNIYGCYMFYGRGVFSVSGKKPAEVDRNFAYMTRYMDQNIVATCLQINVRYRYQMLSSLLWHNECYYVIGYS